MAMKTDLPDVHELRTLRFRLIERRTVLEGEKRTHTLAARTVADHEPGGDAVPLAQMREIDLAEADRDAHEIDAINLALKRMDGGDYGLCSGCGAAIGHARLFANPHALRCIACESAGERVAGTRH